MKKFLLTASMLVMGFVATFAQNWEVGEEITGKISNPSFTEAELTPWKFDFESGSPTTTGGVVELWNGSGADIYQYIELPAGMYKLECQGYYRHGNGWSADPTAYGTDQWEDNALLYVQNGKYNVESGEFVAGRTFKTPLMPRLFEYSESKIYDMTEAGDADPGWDMSDNDCTGQGWGWSPASIPGSLKWFGLGKFSPVDDGDNKYNTVTFFLTENGYVRIGVSKTKAVSEDSFMATNFKLYYAGEAGEAAELMANQEEVDDLYTQLETLRDQNPGFLAGRLSDELMLYDMEYGSSSDMDLEGCAAAKDVLFALLENAKAAQKDLTALKTAINAIDVLTTTTEYPGLEALVKVLDDAKASISEEYVYEGDEEWDTYQTLTNALYAARLEYLKSSPKLEDGSWDFTAFINYHWFCNPEYEPSWDAETNAWVPNQAALDLGWSEKDDVNGTAADIASMVKLGTDQSVVGEWYRVNTSLEVYWNDNLPCVKKWDTPHPEDDVREVAQKIVGIPNGFYKLKALGQTWSQDWDQGEKLCKCRIYAKSGDMVSESPYLELGGWWGKDINQWKELETDFVEVKNGELIVAGHDNGFIAWTNFRLYYYGETPDFNALIKPSLDKTKDAAAALAWAGDQKAAEAIIAKIPASINSNEEFLAASEILAEANDYISKANNAVNNWKGLDNFTNLLNQYQEGSVEKTIVNVALAETMEVGEGEADTYEDAIANNEQYNAYVAYLTYRESIGEFIKEASVAPIVEEQNAYLTGNFATPEKLDEFKLAIGVEYNKAKFAAEGIDKATLTDPKSVTFLLINPSFDEGPIDESQNWSTVKGWSGEGTGAPTANQYSYNEKGQKTVAELWNRGKFTFSQVVSGLPAGTYELRARALYRDGGGVSKESIDKYNAAGGEENWENHNAVLFAKSSDNEWRSYVKAIQSLKATENSFTQCGTAWEVDEVSGDSYATEITYMAGTIEESDQKEGVKYTSVNEGAYPLDVKVTYTDEETLDEVNYYYPASMAGFYAACKKDPNAFTNSVIFYISESSNIELGIKKTAAIGSDWVIMDDFELYYLGKVAPTAIDEVADNAAAQGAVEYYSVNGVKLNAPQAGLNIVKYANGEVRKVFINK